MLPTRPLDLVAGALALERPLMLKRLGFRLKLADGGNRQRDLEPVNDFETCFRLV